MGDEFAQKYRSRGGQSRIRNEGRNSGDCTAAAFVEDTGGPENEEGQHVKITAMAETCPGRSVEPVVKVRGIEKPEEKKIRQEQIDQAPEIRITRSKEKKAQKPDQIERVAIEEAVVGVEKVGIEELQVARF